MEKIKAIKNIQEEKQNLWEIKFIDKMLFFSKKNEIKKKIPSIKSFNLASFSIDTSAKLYAEKVDSLYLFVSKFLKNLIKKKINISKKIEKELGKEKEKVITLKTNITKQTLEKNTKNLFKKSISFFCFPIFINIDFFFFLENSKKLKNFFKKMVNHKNNFLRKSEQDSLAFWDPKKINLSSLKITNYQNNLQIINPKQIFLNEFYPINNSKETNFFFYDSSSKIGFNSTSFSENFFSFSESNFLKKTNLKKSLNQFLFKKKRQLNSKKTKKKIYFFDFIFSKKFSYTNSKPFSFFLSSNASFNYFLNSWDNFFFKKIFYISKKINKTSEKNNNHSLSFFNSNDIEFPLKPIYNTYHSISGNDKKKKFLEFEKKFQIFSFSKSNIVFIKSHEFIFFLKNFENKKVKIANEKMKKKFNFQSEKICFFVYIYPKSLFMKCLSSLNYQNKAKKSFISYLICFLHNAFQDELFLIIDINLNNFIMLKHV